MNQIARFELGGEEFPLEILDHRGDRWVSRKQLEAALGVDRLEPLHRRLLERGELREGIHWEGFRVDATRNPQGGNPNIIIYSYRGIIRVGMASEGQRAVAFRDWAEEVLYQVMVTGTYRAEPDICSRETLYYRKAATKDGFLSARIPAEAEARMKGVAAASGMTSSAVTEQAILFFLKHAFPEHGPESSGDTLLNSVFFPKLPCLISFLCQGNELSKVSPKLP